MADSKELPTQDDLKVRFLRKGKSMKPKGLRKRSVERDSADFSVDSDSSQSVIPKHSTLPSLPSVFSSSSKRSKQDSSTPLDPIHFASSGSAAQLSSNDATRTLDVDGNDDKQQLIISGDPEDPDFDDSLYRGLASYKEFVNKKTENPSQISAASRIRAGPLRGQTNVRISSRFDYQPDICKDYKLTGYCGYGDSCKCMLYISSSFFLNIDVTNKPVMHDRGDYKTGWQIDKEWDEQQRLKKEGKLDDDESRFLIPENEPEDNADSDDDLPFA
ncbi:hypothetical protein HK096_002304, partial [Nowakowskiella sp. JEL0078]